jgi:hypothetical protein
MYVHVGEHAYICSASTYNQSSYVDGVYSRYFHLQRNSRKSEEENIRTETTVRQSLYFLFFAIHIEVT